MMKWFAGEIRKIFDRGSSWTARWLRTLRLFMVAGFAGALLVALYGIVLYPFTPSIDELSALKEARPTVVLSDEGEELTRYARRHREWVDLEEVSPHAVDALIATEDRRFYEHGGLDYWRLASAAVQSLTGDLQGGSTLTQQLARNLYPSEIGRGLTLTRKLKEVITALKIERAYTKDEILETYLNTVPFLYNAHGIELAARTYFSTSASELTLTQSATLVGMLKGTSYYNPKRNPERALARRDVVLGQMVRFGDLPAEERDRLREEPLGVRFERQPVAKSEAPHFTSRVREWLGEWARANGYDVEVDGLVVHTTLDLELQQIAQEAAERYGEALQSVADAEWGRSSSTLRSTSLWDYSSGDDPFGHFWQSKSSLVDAFIRETDAFRSRAGRSSEEDALQSLRSDAAFMDSLRQVKTRLEVGFTAMDPRTGHVKAYVGSRDFHRAPYDRVSEARRQPGSTFKPFVYGAALEAGLRPSDRFRDREVTIRLAGGRTWTPSNAGGSTGEVMTLSDGLALSKNTITAQVVDEVGAGDVADFARRAGVRKSELREVPSLALGTSEVTLIEMASAYATIASGGTYREPVYVTRIEDEEGRELASFSTESEQVISRQVALELADMMRGVVGYGTGTGARRIFGIRADVAGKTGTTQHGADGWFMLMSPELVAGSWVGFDDPRVTFRSSYWGQGAHNALYVTGDIFAKALRRGLVDARATFESPAPRERERRSFTRRVEAWFEDLTGSIFGGGDRDERREEAREERRERQQERAEERRERRQELEEERREREEERRERERERREQERERSKRIGW